MPIPLHGQRCEFQVEVPGRAPIRLCHHEAASCQPTQMPYFLAALARQLMEDPKGYFEAAFPRLIGKPTKNDDGTDNAFAKVNSGRELRFKLYRDAILIPKDKGVKKADPGAPVVPTYPDDLAAAIAAAVPLVHAYPRLCDSQKLAIGLTWRVVVASPDEAPQVALTIHDRDNKPPQREYALADVDTFMDVLTAEDVIEVLAGK